MRLTEAQLTRRAAIVSEIIRFAIRFDAKTAWTHYRSQRFRYLHLAESFRRTPTCETYTRSEQLDLLSLREAARILRACYPEPMPEESLEGDDLIRAYADGRRKVTPETAWSHITPLQAALRAHGIDYFAPDPAKRHSAATILHWPYATQGHKTSKGFRFDGSVRQVCQEALHLIFPDQGAA